MDNKGCPYTSYTIIRLGFKHHPFSEDTVEGYVTSNEVFPGDRELFMSSLLMPNSSQRLNPELPMDPC